MNSRAIVMPPVTKECEITEFVRQYNRPLCWAACIATIINYKWDFGLTAEDVADYNAMDDFAGAELEDTLAAINYFDNSYLSTENRLSWSVIKSKIDNDYPFIAGIEYYYDDVLKGKHVLTGYGYTHAYNDTTANQSQRYVSAWDPENAKLSFQYDNEYFSYSGYDCKWVSSIYHN